ncbi:MAG: glycosyltransferase family 1 protein, partial [Chloroflexales bacterium]
MINGSFWGQPNVGSGQYLHGLLRWLPQVAPQHRYLLLLPAGDGPGAAPPPGVSAVTVRTPFDRVSPNL